ncbi:hypothetical protein [Pseudomonas khavaziana]|uniref:CBM-cenC domain-containing protein n=1 Tax=Pseudomonas khavaziana TaxID=2842351 RepID=A0ABZ2DCS5_9PSED
MAKQTSTPEAPSNTDNASTLQTLESITPQPQALEVDAPIISSELYGTITAEAMEQDSYLTVDSRMDRLDITVKFSIKEKPEIRLNDVVDSSGQPGARKILIPQKYLTMSMGYTLIVWYEGTVSGKPAVSLTKEVGVTFYSAEQSKAIAPRLRDEKIFQNTPTYDMHDHKGDEIVEIPIPPLAQVGDEIYCSVVIEQFSGKPVFYIVAYGYALTLADIASGEKLEFPIPRGWLARQKPRWESITCQAAWITSGEDPQPPADVENPDEETRLPRNALQIQHRRTAAFIGDQGLENLLPPHLRQSAFFDDKWCLNPELTKNGGDVDAPELETYADDEICFYVSGPGYGSKLLGCVEIKNDGDPASVKLPRCVVACFFNKAMTLSYTVRFPNLMFLEPESPERVVDVLKPVLSPSEIAEATHGKVNLNIFSGDATAFVHIGDYARCSAYCWMWIIGELEDGSDKEYQLDILTRELVTEDWKNKGVEAFIHRDKLQQLADCSDFKLLFAVSYCEVSDRSEAIEAPPATFHIIQEDLVLPAPKVDKAQEGELEPWNAQEGVEVSASYLRMSDKHQISLCWKKPNGLCWEVKPQPGSREGVVKFSLPADAAIESMGETVEITYTVITKCREAQTSAPLSLKINLPTRLETPNVLEATPPGVDHGILDMRAITGNANSFEDPMWFLRKGQKCWLRATGTDKNGFSYTFDVYANRTVTDEEATKGVAGPIQHASLDRLKNNSTLTLAFSVSTQGNLKENVVCPLRVLTVKAVLNDFTPFIGGNWNSWRLGSAANGELVYGSHAGKSCLVNWTSRPAVLGVLLYKDFTGLEVNRRYEFSMIACSLNATPALPKLSLRTNAGAVTNVITLSSTAWTPLKGSFVASAESMRLEILNHEGAGYGNDYAFTDIRVHG